MMSMHEVDILFMEDSRPLETCAMQPLAGGAMAVLAVEGLGARELVLDAAAVALGLVLDVEIGRLVDLVGGAVLPFVFGLVLRGAVVVVGCATFFRVGHFGGLVVEDGDGTELAREESEAGPGKVDGCGTRRLGQSGGQDRAECGHAMSIGGEVGRKPTDKVMKVVCCALE